MGIHVWRHLNEELTWATDKRLWVISNIMLFETVIATSKKLKNKAFLSLNNIIILCAAMWSLVMYSNCLVKYYRMMLHGHTIKVFLYLVLFNSVSLHYK